jgi:hypothetical protein
MGRKAGITLSKRITAAVAGLCAAGTLIGLGAAGVVARTNAHARADSGTAYASTNRVVGKIGYGSATNSDKILGASAVTFKYTLTSQGGGKFKLNSTRTVLYTPKGALKGTLSATVTLAGTTETFTNGKLNLTTGTGSQKGHSLVGTFTGSGSETDNQFKITYKGKYK